MFLKNLNEKYFFKTSKISLNFCSFFKKLDHSSMNTILIPSILQEKNSYPTLYSFLYWYVVKCFTDIKQTLINNLDFIPNFFKALEDYQYYKHFY